MFHRLATALVATMLSAGSASALTVVSGTITSNMVWGVGTFPCPIVLDGPVAVGDGIDETPAVAGSFNDKVTLTILPGCIVRGQPRTAAGPGGEPGALVVTRTGALIAEGVSVASATIVFTTAATDNDGDGNPDRSGGFLEPWDPGDTFFDDDPQTTPKAPLAADGTSNVELWGGLALLGNAPVNVGTGCATAIEGSCNLTGLDPLGTLTLAQLTYGGRDSHDSSGRLSYVSVRHGGDAGGAEPLDGITLAGVGDETAFRFIETYANYDDGIQWLGGTVNGSHLVATLMGDDLWDTDQGWVGCNQFLFGVMPWFGEADGAPDLPGPPLVEVGLFGASSGDKAGEFDGDDFNEPAGASASCLPASSGHFANMTVIGSGPDPQVPLPNFTPAATDVAGVAANRGIQMRNGFGGSVINSILLNTIGNGVDVDSNVADGCPGFSTTEQIATCTTRVVSSTLSSVPVPLGDEQALLDCGDDTTGVSCGTVGCNVVNPMPPAFSMLNPDATFDPQGDANGDLVSTLKSPPLQPEVTGFTGTVGGLPTRCACGDDSATYRGAFDSSLSTLWVDGWTVLSIAGLVEAF